MKYTALVFSALLATQAAADIEATTKDGRKVLLDDNGTWHYLLETDQEQAPKMAELVLEHRQALPHGCRLGLRMTNHMESQIRTLVLRFTAFKQGDIPFETVSRGYSFIKPTTDQYQEIQFRGITCDEIDKVQVRAAHNCHVGELTKYSASEERCLELVDVKASELVTLFKKPLSPEPQSAAGQ